jgi:FHA domain
MVKTYTVHRISSLPLFNLGFLIGAIGSFFPIATVILLVKWGISSLATWMNDLTYKVEFPIKSPIPGVDFPSIVIKPIELLKLQDVQSQLQNIGDTAWFKVILLILGLTILAGLYFGVIALIAGEVFNLASSIFGRLKLKLSDGGTAPVQPASGQPVPMPPAVPLPNLQTPAPGGPRLEITQPIQKIVAVTTPVMIIGSDPGCNLQLNGLMPRHAQISLEQGLYILYDFSQGQSQVQGQIVRGPNMLKDGFLIHLGQYAITFRQ